MKHAEIKSNKKVAKTARDAVLNVADRVQDLKEKTWRAWEESKPRQQKIKENLRVAGEKVVAFGKDVGTGFKEGIAEVQKRNKKRGASV